MKYVRNSARRADFDVGVWDVGGIATTSINRAVTNLTAAVTCFNRSWCHIIFSLSQY